MITLYALIAAAAAKKVEQLAKAHDGISKFTDGPTLPWANVVVTPNDHVYYTSNSEEGVPNPYPYADWGIVLFVFYKLVMVFAMNYQRYSFTVEPPDKPWYKQPRCIAGWLLTLVAPWCIMYPASLLCPLWEMLPFGVIAIFANTFINVLMTGQSLALKDTAQTFVMSGTSFLALFSAKNAKELTEAAINTADAAQKAMGAADDSMGKLKGISGSVSTAASAGVHSIVPEADVLTEVHNGASRMLLVAYSTLKAEYSGTNFWVTTIVSFVLIFVFMYLKWKMMKDVMNDFAQLKADFVALFTYQAVCGFLVGIASAINGTLFHGGALIAGTIFHEAGGLDDIIKAVEAVLSSGLCWSIGLPGLITYVLYYYYVPSSLKDCSAKTFVVAQQQSENIVTLVAFMVMCKWYEHLPFFWLGMMLLGVVIAVAVMFCYIESTSQEHVSPPPDPPPPDPPIPPEPPIGCADCCGDPSCGTCGGFCGNGKTIKVGCNPKKQGGVGLFCCAAQKDAPTRGDHLLKPQNSDNQV